MTISITYEFKNIPISHNNKTNNQIKVNRNKIQYDKREFYAHTQTDFAKTKCSVEDFCHVTLSIC